jgi:hypothetical protein
MITSAAPCISPAAGPGERIIPAIGASPRAPALRLKTSQQRKLLVPLAKRAFRAFTATRSLNGTTGCSDWLNCPSRGDAATRRHRPHHRPFVTPWPRHSRHVAGTGRSAALTAEGGGRDRLGDVRKDPRLPGSSGPDHHSDRPHARSEPQDRRQVAGAPTLRTPAAPSAQQHP